MKLPAPPAKYDQRDQAEARTLIERADAATYHRGQDIELQAGQRLIMPSPNGDRWLITVSNAGALVVTAL